MKFLRQQDMVDSIEPEAEFGVPFAPYPGRRFLIGASVRIALLFLCLCLLIASSI
ncbi:MAG TPA: hypothetical protein VF503_13355 [Sphingobium sp.]|uniref:hypothetical protein n=1 Tax=Sphingobium sp. TaxID=1912891 RepID=UPI002ED26666